MEVKKNPNVDVGRNSSLYFAIGLNLMLLSTYLLFEHKFYENTTYERDIVQMDEIIEEDIPIVNIDVPPPPPPPPAVVSEDLRIVEDVVEIEETIIESSEIGQDDAIEYVANVEDVEVEEVEEDIVVPFRVIENVPVFPGCETGTKEQKMECFQRSIQAHVKKHFKYPETALELGMHGKVFVLFVIDKNGNTTKIQTRGPDKLLENEAERIIGLLPKMTPGKQRGRAVSMPYSIPISFVLQD
ncbi:energy transducer TonB [uncultured Psychroserpens sp.]|uniref:energy transducer TonB n=1 Tax=uncultured Psychroserpens sp. TaxID=255436 RepID=UPI00260CF001|nr:energy transducer TonB [uncultured Psychroserpens sp.]